VSVSTRLSVTMGSVRAISWHLKDTPREVSIKTRLLNSKGSCDSLVVSPSISEGDGESARSVLLRPSEMISSFISESESEAFTDFLSDLYTVAILQDDFHRQKSGSGSCSFFSTCIFACEILAGICTFRKPRHLIQV